MDLLASYDDENTGENSMTESPNPAQTKAKSNLAPNVLENEWLSFEQMIAPGGVVGTSEPVKGSDFLVNGIVAYPGMKRASTTGESGLALEEQSSASSESETEVAEVDQSGATGADNKEDAGKEEDDDAFFRLRKQVKERDRSSSTDRSGSSRSSSASSSRSGSPSPPHLSPVNSIKSHTSEPPDLTEREVAQESADVVQIDIAVKDKDEKSSEKTSEEKGRSKERKRSRSKDRKRSHREHRSRRDHSSKSKRKRSRSRSKDRRRRRSSRDRHRHKDKKSRDRKESRGEEKRSKSRERKDSKSESKKSEGKERKESTSENKVSEIQDSSEVKKAVNPERRDSKSDNQRKRSRSRSKDRKDRKKDRKRSRSRHRHRSRDRKSKERKRSRSKERKRSRSRDRKRKQRSRSRDRRSRSRHRSRERHSRSRSRERLRSRSPVLGRKLTFKEQMRKEFINASKEVTQEHKAVTDLDSLRRPGEALRPSDLLKGVKLSSGESVTPQMALMQTMAAMHKKAQELTGVEVPKYYNPAAVNPIKYAEQVQKRKLLWSKKTEEKDKNEQMETQWKSAFVSTDDNKTASKFRKLMGMREGECQSSADEMSEDVQKLSEEQKRKQAELFQRLDQEYQFARMTTHTQRGVGLGFSTTVIDPNHPQNPP